MGGAIKELQIGAIFQLFIIAFSLFANASINCWGVDGELWTDQQKCSESGACCGLSATCDEDTRLCRNSNRDLVRGPCSQSPYSFDNCAQLCLINETLANHTFPRVKVCPDGSLCCDYQGDQCCDSGLGVFIQNGVLVNNGSGAGSTAASNGSTDASSTTGNKDGGDNSLARTVGLGVGLGLGLPLVFIIGGIAIWAILRRHSRKQRSGGQTETDPVAHTPSTPKAETYQEGQHPHIVPAVELPPHGS